MCITVEKARLSNTILLAHQVEHEGRMVNVLGYQNQAMSWSVKPNAMILPIPSAVPMGPENCIDMTGAEETFRAYEKVIRPRKRSISIACAAGPMTNEVQVFDTGSYTVLLTQKVNLKALREAMGTLPEGKRLDLNFGQAKIFSSFRKLYPDWHIAICIWEGEITPEPLLWWYEPMAEFKDKHFLPGLDAHDGEPPDPSRKSIQLDHTLVIGASKAEERFRNNASDVVGDAPAHLRKWLPNTVFGAMLHDRPVRNGDWVFPKECWNYDTAQTRIDGPRVPPPGYQE